MKRYYLAYGSNLNIQQMGFRCPAAHIMGTGFIKDYGLLFKGSRSGAYLTIEPKPGERVPVAVWEVTSEDEAALDRYEGYPDFYYKKEMEIVYQGISTNRMRKRRAFVYIMHEERKPGIPSPQYIRTCLSGYRSFGFDEDMIFQALQTSKEAMT